METGLTKSVNDPFSPQGIYIGLVKRVDLTLKKVWVQIGRLAGKKTFGPLSIVGVMPQMGERVACAFTEANEIIVIGVLQQTASPGPIDGGMIVQDEPPEPLKVGAQWYDTSTAQEYVAIDNGSGTLVWVQSGGAGPAGPPGESGNPPETATILTAETTTNGISYTDLATVGPSVSLETGRIVKVTYGAGFRYTSGSGTGYMSFGVSGASTVPLVDSTFCCVIDGGNAQNVGGALWPRIQVQNSTVLYRAQEAIVNGLTPGTNTFKCQYLSTIGTTSEFRNRFISVERID